MDKPYDKSGKYLLKHHGGSILRLGGVAGVRAWRAAPPELVQPSQLPDGLLEADLEGRPDPVLTLVEIATFPERRVEEQMLRGALLVLLERRQLPEVLTLVLRPRGRYQVPGTLSLQSPLGLTGLRLSWRVVELWTLPAEQLLAASDIGLVPWVPLTLFDGPPEALLRRCRERIDHQAPPQQHENLLTVTQVLAALRYNDPQLLAILGGRKAMIESPYLQEIVEEQVELRLQQRVAEQVELRLQQRVAEQVELRLQQRVHEDILLVLAERFGAVPPDIQVAVQGVREEARLRSLVSLAVKCHDLDAFRTRLPA